MPAAHINGVELYYELTGSGEPLVLVHGCGVTATGIPWYPRSPNRFASLPTTGAGTAPASDRPGRAACSRMLMTSPG